jgi:translation elongation factor EF-Ts
MLQKRFYAESVLTEQVWIHDTSKSVAQALSEAGLEVLEFRRVSVS